MIIQPVGEHETQTFEKEYIFLSEHYKKISFLAFKVNDWNKELSPWEAPQAFGNEPFGSGATQTLKFVTDNLLPEIKKTIEVTERTKLILGGYSLAGLFSLWCSYQTNIFNAIAAVSPSVWIEGWQEYAESHEVKIKTVYLSLGNKEHKTRNPMLRSVKDKIIRQHDLLSSTGTDTVLEWNEGNHFTEPELRTAKGFAWCLNNLSASQTVRNSDRLKK